MERDLLKEYVLLYRSESKSMPSLVEFGKKVYPDYIFTIRDGFNEPYHKVERSIKKIIIRPVKAINGLNKLSFKSLTKCAKHFKVDRFTIATRIISGKDFDGWTFTYMSP